MNDDNNFKKYSKLAERHNKCSLAVFNKPRFQCKCYRC